MNALERLRASPRPRVLMVSHAFGGGVARHLADLVAAVAQDVEVLLLRPDGAGSVALRWIRDGETLALWFDAEREWTALLQVLAGIGIERVHFHHVHGFPPAVLELPRMLACGHDLTLHDFFPACPEYHLTGGDNRFCGGAADCRRCLDKAPAQWKLSIDEWRVRFAALLAGAGRVIAPSRDAAQRLQVFFPRVAPVVWPHPRPVASPLTPPLRVLVPGAISPEKGLALLEACVRDAASRALPLHFRVLGYTASAIPQWPELPFSLSGEFPEGALPALIAHEGGDLFFFPALCPETYSYTLSDAMATGLPIVATDLGAFPERLANHPQARVVPWSATPSAFNDALLSAAGAAPASPRAPSEHGTPLAQYRAWYLEAIPPASRSPQAPLPAIAASWLEAPAIDDKPVTTLTWHYRDAFLCGRGLSRARLERGIAAAEARLEEDARRVAELHASTSWRLTAPLRALKRLIRR